MLILSYIHHRPFFVNCRALVDFTALNLSTKFTALPIFHLAMTVEREGDSPPIPLPNSINKSTRQAQLNRDKAAESRQT